MKKILLTFVLVTMAIFTFSQKGIEISFKTKDGIIIKKDADIYTTSAFKIHGLKTHDEYEQLKATALKNENVVKFEYLSETKPDGSLSAIASFKNNEDSTIFDFLKSINVKEITINDNSFTLEQKEELKKYIKELKAKYRERNSKPTLHKKVNSSSK